MAFDTTKFSTILTKHAATVLNTTPEAVPGDFISTLLDTLMGFLTSCMGGGSTTTPAQAAANIKNANDFQQRRIKRDIRKEYHRSGKSRADADAAFQTLLLAGAETPEADLAAAISDAQQDNSGIPDFTMG